MEKRLKPEPITQPKTPPKGKGAPVVFGRTLDPDEKAKALLKAKAWDNMTRAEKDEVTALMLQHLGWIE
jgi:hypothetical protein